MRRTSYPPRPNWQQKMEALGFSYHTIDGETYWDESAYYDFSPLEIQKLEATTNELHRLCVEAGELAIRENWRARLHISEPAWAEVVAAWERDDPTLYGRFDLLWDGIGDPKLLEYNADTPTGLLEASVVQWHWLRDRFPDKDQFNSIHEALIANWQTWPEKLYFTALEDAEEDWRNLLYLEDTARQAGKITANFGISQLGWHPGKQAFVTEDDQEMQMLFKLYPWEWMWQEDFAVHLPGRTQQFMEPVWKMLWSNKALLVLLWEKFPDHPNLLAASFQESVMGRDYVAKPMFGREGSNVRIVKRGQSVAMADGPWAAQPMVYQKLGPEVAFSSNHPVIGSWVIGGEACGIGIREDTSLITANGSRFLPHLFS
jgi:glutathionylspermidine synthase